MAWRSTLLDNSPPLDDAAQGAITTFAINYGGEKLMIKRFAGTTPTRSRAVTYGGIVYAVATAKNKAAPLYEQTKDALAQIDSTLADAGSDKSRILRATIYITDMSRKPDMDRAWNEWVDRANAPQRACIGATLADTDLVEILVTAAQQ